MNAQPILARIEQDARDAAAGLLRDAQSRAEALRNASEQRIETGREAAMEQARKDALALDDRMQRMAKLDARKALLAAKRTVLDEAFARALAKMRAMPDKDARAFGLAQVLEAAQGDETLVPDTGAKWCDQAFVDEANAALKNAGKNGQIALSKETRALGGGFLLLRGGMEINCSYQAALDAQRLNMEAEIAALLFE